MVAESTSLIRSVLQELVTSFQQHPKGDYCAQFTPAGADSPWVQVIADAINFHYPFDDDPATRLRLLPIAPLPSMHCTSWKPGTYATLELEDLLDLEWLSQFINGLFVSLYGCGATCTIQSSIGLL